jgi:hypothetical protein
VKIRCGAVEVPGTGALEGYSNATAWDPTVGGKGEGVCQKCWLYFRFCVNFVLRVIFYTALPVVTIQDLRPKTYIRTGA